MTPCRVSTSSGLSQLPCQVTPAYDHVSSREFLLDGLPILSPQFDTFPLRVLSLKSSIGAGHCHLWLRSVWDHNFASNFGANDFP